MQNTYNMNTGNQHLPPASNEQYDEFEEYEKEADGQEPESSENQNGSKRRRSRRQKPQVFELEWRGDNPYPQDTHNLETCVFDDVSGYENQMFGYGDPTQPLYPPPQSSQPAISFPRPPPIAPVLSPKPISEPQETPFVYYQPQRSPPWGKDPPGEAPNEGDAPSDGSRKSKKEKQQRERR